MRVPATLHSAWESVRTSYWFVPSLLTIGAVLLSFGMLAVDQALGDRWSDTPWLYIGSADGARAILTTIAASMIGTAGVVFSIAIVALVLASSQFGPRMLRNFMRDMGNQIVLGTFIAIFLYCLLILRQVHGSEEGSFESFVPQLSLIVAVLLAIAGAGVLIYFIHHISVAIQAPVVIANVSSELRRTLGSSASQDIGDDSGRSEQEEADARQQLPVDFDANAAPIEAASGGYIQHVQLSELLAIATDRDLIVRVVHTPGRFVEKGDPVLRVWPATRMDDTLQKRLQGSFAVRLQRSLTQDAEFAIEQLVQISVRALSPAVNDPFSAMLCIDRLGEALGQFAHQRDPSPFLLDDAGRLRVITPVLDFCHFVGTAFHPIRRCSRDMLLVMISLLGAYERLAHHLGPGREAERQCLAEHAQMIYDQAITAVDADADRQTISKRHDAARRAIGR